MYTFIGHRFYLRAPAISGGVYGWTRALQPSCRLHPDKGGTNDAMSLDQGFSLKTDMH